MKNREEKKICTPDLFPSNRDLGKRWFVYYYEPTHGGNSSKRVKVYGQLNCPKTLEERLNHANELMKTISSSRLPNLTGQVEKKKKTSILESTLEKYRPTLRLKTYQSHKSKIKLFNIWLTERKMKDWQITTDIANTFLLWLLENGCEIYSRLCNYSMSLKNSDRLIP